MSTTYEIYDFPTLKTKEQLFYAPGQAYEGGFTSGGVRISSPEPGGRAYCDVQLSVNKFEWDYPYVSWLMSNCSNGEILRYKLVETPQLVPRYKLLTDVNGNPWDNDQPWSNDLNWDGADIGPQAFVQTLVGSNQLVVDMTLFGQILQAGHVIGFKYDCHIVKKIAYSIDAVTGKQLATLTISPPARRTINVNDYTTFRPMFTGSISNGANFRKTYDAADRGLIMPGKLTLSEVIL